MELKNQSLSELTWNLVPYYGKKAESRGVSDIIKPSRFVEASEVSQRSFLKVENFFQNYLKEVDFIELSPLQPLGLNCVLAKTSGKKLIPTIRGQEVNSDATTALFLEAYRRLGDKTDIRVATNVRTVRPKIFSKESGFLPHFKVFAEVSLGRQIVPFGKKEVDIIVRHLVDELKMLCVLRENIPNNIVSLNVYISNLIFLLDIVERSLPDKTDNIVEYAHKLWSVSGMPATLPLDDRIVDKLKSYGFIKGIKILEMFLSALKESDGLDGNIKWFFDLSRSAGMGYYRHLVYKITAVSEFGNELPLADGGSNNWGTKMSGDKQLYVVSSGIGTELLIKNHLELA